MPQEHSQSKSSFALPFGGGAQVASKNLFEEARLSDVFEWRDPVIEKDFRKETLVKSDAQSPVNLVPVSNAALLSPGPKRVPKSDNSLRAALTTNKRTVGATGRSYRRPIMGALMLLVLLSVPPFVQNQPVVTPEIGILLAQVRPSPISERYEDPSELARLPSREKLGGPSLGAGPSLPIATDLDQAFGAINSEDETISAIRRSAGLGYFGEKVSEVQFPVKVGDRLLAQPVVLLFPTFPAKVVGKPTQFEPPRTMETSERAILPKKFKHAPFAQVLIPSVMENESEILQN